MPKFIIYKLGNKWIAQRDRGRVIKGEVFRMETSKKVTAEQFARRKQEAEIKMIEDKDKLSSVSQTAEVVVEDK